MSSLFGMNEKQSNGISTNILDGFNFSTKRKQMTPIVEFDYDGVMVLALPGPTRKTPRYDMEFNNFIKKNFPKERPTYVIMGFKGKECVVMFDNPDFIDDGIKLSENNIISNKNKVQELIKISGCKMPVEEGDELRLYFNLIPILGGIYRLDILQTPKNK